MGRKEHTIHSFYFSQGKGSAVCNLHQFWHFVVKRRFWTIFLEQHAFWKNFDHKIIFFLLHVFMFSKQMTKCETVSFIRDCIFRNYPSQRRHRQHVNTTPFKRIISVFYASWHLFVISLVLPPLYLMLRPFSLLHDQWRPPWPKSKVNAIISPDVFVF